VIQEESNRQQKVPDVAHPRQVAQAAELPIMNELGDEESQRQKPSTETCSGKLPAQPEIITLNSR
jgi:hypothetical protein